MEQRNRPSSNQLECHNHGSGHFGRHLGSVARSFSAASVTASPNNGFTVIDFASARRMFR